METEDRKMLMDYYTSTRAMYDASHNHKETAAWAGLALHLVVCGQVAQLNPPDTNGVTYVIGLTLILCTIGILTFKYITKQLDFKDVYGSYSSAAGYLLTEIGTSHDVKASDYLATVEISGDMSTQARHSLPKRLQEDADEFFSLAGTGKRKTRRLVNTILIASSIAAVGFVWLKWYGHQVQSVSG